MKLMSVDGVDVSTCTCKAVADLLLERAEQRERLLMFAKPSETKERSAFADFLLFVMFTVCVLGVGVLIYMKYGHGHRDQASIASMHKAREVLNRLAANNALGLERSFLEAVVWPALAPV
jgi:hypothetical protein